MRMWLDTQRRFEVVSTVGGWDIIFDNCHVSYARDLKTALEYMAESLIDDSQPQDLNDVLLALDRVKSVMTRATDIVRVHEATKIVARVLSRLRQMDGDGVERRDKIIAASLILSGCKNECELRERDDRKDIILRARAILDTRADFEK